MRTMCYTLGSLIGLGLLAPAWSQGPESSFKGQVKIGQHKQKLERGKLYRVKVESDGFRPNVTVRPGYFIHTGEANQGDTFLGFLFPQESREYKFLVLPNLFDEIGDGPLNYTMQISNIPLAEKPVLEEKAKLEKADPIYKNPDLGFDKKCLFKAFPIKMQAKQFYIIDMVRSGDDIDPYLYLEGPDGKIVASDDDSGGSLNARIIYQPRRSGAYRIIASTLVPATGAFTLTVRSQAKEKE